MAVAVAQLLHALDDKDSDVRRAAVRALARGAVTGDAAAISLVVRKAEDSDEDVRQEAVSCLRLVCHPGDAEAVHVASRLLLKDPDEHVRKAAARALAAVASPGDSQAIAALVSGLEDEEDDVREEVDDALQRVCAGGSDFALDKLNQLLGDTQKSETRVSVLRVMPRVATGAGTGPLPGLLPHAADEDDEVRWAFATAVGKLAAKGDQHAVSKLLELARDEDRDVRRESLKALAVVANAGDDSVIKVAVDRLRDEANSVRCAAVGLLAVIEERGAHDTLAVIRSLLDSKDEDLRCTGLEALAVIGPVGDPDVIASIQKHLEESDEDVRQAAVVAIASLASRGCDSTAVMMLLPLVRDDESEEVRIVAMKALSSVAPVGDQVATSCLLQGLQNEEEGCVRAACVEALACVAERGSLEVLQALTRILQGDNFELRRAAGLAIPAVAGRDHDAAWALIEPLFTCGETTVRCAVLECAALLTNAESTRRVDKVACLIEDTDASVRDVAGDALAAYEGDTSLVISQIEARCRSQAPNVRMAALEAACKLVPKAGMVAVGLLLEAFRDPHQNVRQASARLIGGLPAVVDEALTVAVAEQCLRSFENLDRGGQQAAVEALGALCPRGDRFAMEAVSRYASSEAPRARRAAFDLAAVVAPYGDRSCIRLAAAAIQDGNERVRDAAVLALRSIVKNGTQGGVDQFGLSAASADAALSAVGESLDHASEEVRASVADAIAAVAQVGDANAVTMLLKLTSDSDLDVRWSALRALARVATRGDERAVAAALQSVQEEDEQVSIAAIEALSHLAGPGDPAVVAALRPCLQGTSDIQRVALRALLDLYTGEDAAKIMQAAGLAGHVV